MSEVVTFVDYQPPQRFDATPWTNARVEECATADGIYTLIETIPLSPLDSDPADPMFRSFTTENGTAVDYWYRIVFSDSDGDLSVPTAPAQNSVGVTSYPVAYATVEELQRLLRLGEGAQPVTTLQLAGMQRCLDSAATEIDWDLGYTSSSPSPQPPHPLVVEVNLERAVEHWRQSFSPFGVIGLGAESEPVVTARNSWYRHHLKLAPLRQHVGVA